VRRFKISGFHIYFVLGKRGALKKPLFFIVVNVYFFSELSLLVFEAIQKKTTEKLMKYGKNRISEFFKEL
jgi:hypothetical protein